jgi:NAD(P)-dependent dehydrogenase (short-subunit alcohol dehydrogenase family)
MRAGGRGGSIVNITTIEAHRAAPGFAVYSAAKAAVEQFARTLAVELAPDGIRVNNVAPDYVPTPNLRRMPHADGGTGASAGWFNWPETGWANYAPMRYLAADTENQ